MGGSGPAGTGRLEEPGPARAPFTGGSPSAIRGSHGHRGRGSHPSAGHGNSEAGSKIWGARRTGPASCSSRGWQGPAEPPGSPAWTGRAAGGRGRASRCPPARPREIFVNEEMHKRSSLGESAELEASPAAPGRGLPVPGAGRAWEGTGAAPAAAPARSRFGGSGRASRWLQGLQPGPALAGPARWLGVCGELGAPGCPPLAGPEFGVQTPPGVARSPRFFSAPKFPVRPEERGEVGIHSRPLPGGSEVLTRGAAGDLGLN